MLSCTSTLGIHISVSHLRKPVTPPTKLLSLIAHMDARADGRRSRSGPQAHSLLLLEGVNDLLDVHDVPVGLLSDVLAQYHAAVPASGRRCSREGPGAQELSAGTWWCKAQAATHACVRNEHRVAWHGTMSGRPSHPVQVQTVSCSCRPWLAAAEATLLSAWPLSGPSAHVRAARIHSAPSLCVPCRRADCSAIHTPAPAPIPVPPSPDEQRGGALQPRLHVSGAVAHHHNALVAVLFLHDQRGMHTGMQSAA